MTEIDLHVHDDLHTSIPLEKIRRVGCGQRSIASSPISCFIQSNPGLPTPNRRVPAHPITSTGYQIETDVDQGIKTDVDQDHQVVRSGNRVVT